jgi:hypothetical protein
MLVAVALAAGVAACGGAGSSSSSSATGAAPSSSGTTSTTTSGSTSGSTSAGTAAPGTKLSVGQSATVKYTPLSGSGKGKSATLKVTVESLQKGSLADFKGVQLDATQKASTPFYVKVHVANMGPVDVDINGTSAAIEGVDNTGSTAQSVTFIGDFPPCPDKASSAPLPAGQSYDKCLTFLVPGGISKVAYSGTQAYISSPVTWSSKS